MIAWTVVFFVLSVGVGVMLFGGFAAETSAWMHVAFFASVCGFLLSFLVTLSRRAAALLGDDLPTRNGRADR